MDNVAKIGVVRNCKVDTPTVRLSDERIPEFFFREGQQTKNVWAVNV